MIRGPEPVNMKEETQIDPGLQLFLDARASFQDRLVTKEEILWRIRFVLPAGDRYRKAAE